MATLIDWVFGVSGKEKQNLFRQTDIDILIEKGFSEEEAKNLNWINNTYSAGKFIGAGVGLVFAFNGSGYFKILSKTFPRLKYSDSARWLLAAGVVYAGYYIGDFIATSDYRGNWANTYWANVVSNRNFLLARDEFIRHFEVVNRKLTTDEIKKLRAREQNIFLDTPRSWIYNPAIHGENKEAFDREVHRLNGPQIDEVTLKEVAQQNSEKIARGDQLHHIPYHLNDHIDRTGTKQGTQTFPILRGWKQQE